GTRLVFELLRAWRSCAAGAAGTALDGAVDADLRRCARDRSALPRRSNVSERVGLLRAGQTACFGAADAVSAPGPTARAGRSGGRLTPVSRVALQLSTLGVTPRWHPT